jgi:hypothetical protein
MDLQNLHTVRSHHHPFTPSPGEGCAQGSRLGIRCRGGTTDEVRLAEAYCTEACCGALYVTIVLVGRSAGQRR